MNNIINGFNPEDNPIVVKCQGADLLPLDLILEFQGDLKKLSNKNRDKLIKSICKLGFIAAFFVWNDAGDYRLLDGTQRLKTLIYMRQKGWDIPLLPVVYVEADSEEDARNKLLHITSAYGEFDMTELQSWIDELGDDIEDSIRLVDQEIELALTLPEETLGDDEVDDDVPAITKLGDLWELGNHRVLCGDSTDAETVGKLMDGQKADMVFTDPPYGMHLDTDWSNAKSSLKFASDKNALGGKKHRKVIGDNEDFTPDLINTVFENFGYCKEIFLWGADYYAEYLKSKNDGSWVVWDKRLDESADRMYGSTFELCWSKKKHKRMLARVKWAGIFGTEKEFDHKRHHPTQKPVNLIDWFFDYYSLSDKKKVVDLYGGSGGVLISSEKNNKQCYMMELDEHYCDVIRDRYIEWCKANDRTPVVKLNGEVWNG